jgi:GTPase
VVRAFLFDLDGTLVDSLADIAAAMNEALVEAGLPSHPPDAYRRFVGDGVDALARRAAPGLEGDDGRRSALVARYQAIYEGRLTVATQPYPGVPELVASLRARGLPLAVLSNKPDAATVKLVAALFAAGSFVAARGQRPGVPRKPDPRAALELAAEIGVAPAEIAFVGDTSVDMRTARAAGMVAVGVSWGFRPEELRGAGADLVVDDPAALASLLARPLAACAAARHRAHPPAMPAPPREAAVLVAVQLPGVSDHEHEADLAELGRLVKTLGYDVVARVTQRRDALAAAAVVGGGKLRELARLTGGDGVVPSAARAPQDKARARRAAEAVEADEDEAWAEVDEGDDGDDGAPAGEGAAPERRASVVCVDHDITPSQARNLERATSARVLDRTGVIVEIFHRHARSREARLQVEIARLAYVVPRLREGGGGGERQAGRGAGESALELDRRKVRDRIAELREELAAVQREQGNRRARRREQRRVALVGYTNAGKSSLMRALTGSEVLVEDKLFATLDTTVRALKPDAKPRVLVSDTVGFIKKLPHDLVASFRSTLDEALDASLLLHVVDASDPDFRAQLAVTREVLAEIGADAVPSRLVLNKADRVAPEALERLAAEFPDAVVLSAKSPGDVARLRDLVVAFFDAEMVEGELDVPYARQNLVGEIYEHARVVSETFDERGGRFVVRAHPADLARLRSLLAR